MLEGFVYDHRARRSMCMITSDNIEEAYHDVLQGGVQDSEMLCAYTAGMWRHAVPARVS